MANGYNLITITNSDTPDHTDILCYPDTVTEEGATRDGTLEDDGFRIAAGLGADAVFQDWERESGRAFHYIARSYTSSDGFTDTDPPVEFTNILDGLWVTLVTRDDLTTNAELALNLMITEPPRKEGGPRSVSHEFKGRPRPVTYFGQTIIERLNYPITIPNFSIGDLAILKALEEADDTLCIRDNFGNKMYGRMVNLPISEDIAASSFTLSFVNEHFVEAVI